MCLPTLVIMKKIVIALSYFRQSVQDCNKILPVCLTGYFK